MKGNSSTRVTGGISHFDSSRKETAFNRNEDSEMQIENNHETSFDENFNLVNVPKNTRELNDNNERGKRRKQQCGRKPIA